MSSTSVNVLLARRLQQMAGDMVKARCPSTIHSLDRYLQVPFAVAKGTCTTLHGRPGHPQPSAGGDLARRADGYRYRVHDYAGTVNLCCCFSQALQAAP